MKIVVISGKARHGKDTTASILKELLEADGYRVLITHYGDLVKYVCRMFFDWDGQKDEKGRSLLQYVGTDVIKSQDPGFWISFIKSIIGFFPNEWDYVLIPDCRFPDEIDDLAESGFDTIHLRVLRQNFTSPLSEEQQAHSSETALDDRAPDAWIINNGTLDDLRGVISEWITQENGYHQIGSEYWEGDAQKGSSEISGMG